MEKEIRIVPANLALMRVIQEWDKAKDHIYPLVRPAKFVNEEKRGLVNRDFLDLKVCYMIRYPLEEQVISIVMITELLIQIWGISPEELHETAIQNLLKEGYYIRDLNSVFKELAGIKSDEDELDLNNALYLLSNRWNINGASGMLCPDLIQNFAELRESDLYIIPMNIHELLLAVDDGRNNDDELREMIAEAHGDNRVEEEWLSDHAYFYSRKTGEITCQKG